jgi:hypothetical protein
MFIDFRKPACQVFYKKNIHIINMINNNKEFFKIKLNSLLYDILKNMTVC